MVQHHASELERLDVVLVQHESFLEALHRGLEIPQLSGKRKKRYQEVLVRQRFQTLNSFNANNHSPAVPVGLPEAFIGIYEVRLQLQGLFECLNGFLRRENNRFSHRVTTQR